jgi:hypothetical protein
MYGHAKYCFMCELTVHGCQTCRETELKEQSSQSQPWQDSSNKPLSQRRARKHLNLKLLLPVEIFQEDCLLERRKAPVKRAIWDRDDDSEPADSSILQPLKRMAL